MCQKHVYIDFFFNDKLEFRFDLYGMMPPYKKVAIKNEYFNVIIKNKKEKKIRDEHKNYVIFTPLDIDEMSLRYIEYYEWFEERPDKIKHLNFILDKIKTDKSKQEFLDRIHTFIKIPNNNEEEQPPKKQKLISKILNKAKKILK